MSDRRLRPVVLTIAGSDSGGGAGVQADLRAFWALGCFGTAAITCVTAQNLDGVTRIDATPVAGVAEQIKQVGKGFRVRGVKTGMLYSREIVEAVVRAYDHHLEGVPLVVDPVMVATSGARLLKPDAIEAYGELFRRAAVVTPNLDELEVLVGERPQRVADLETAGRRLLDRFGAPVLAKGGHLEGPAVDVLVTRAGSLRWESPRVSGVRAHGSGCSFASAVAAGLAHGLGLRDAVAQGKAWMDRAFAAPVTVETNQGEVALLGDGHGDPLHG